MAMRSRSGDSKKSPFEELAKRLPDGRQVWESGRLGRLLGYPNLKNFLPVIRRARAAARKAGVDPAEHFLPVSGAQRSGSPRYCLTRLACLMVVQNADPEKPRVAKAQVHFAALVHQQLEVQKRYHALKTMEEKRRAELRKELKARNKHLAKVARVAGVSSHSDFASFQDSGYQGLYGGLHTRQLFHKRGLKGRQHLLDYMSSSELAANLFRVTLAEEQLIKHKVHHRETANRLHYGIGQKIRRAMKGLGSVPPENLPRASRVVALGGAK